MRALRVWTWLGIFTLILAACTVAASREGESAPTATPLPEPQATPTPPVMMAGPEAGAGASGSGIELLPEEDPPPGAASQFRTDFSRHIVPYSEIMSGGPPKDGIPAIDDPQFVSVDAAGAWLAPQEPVIVVQAGDAAHVYPIQILMWHEIVNDTVGDLPVSVTFCPLCNTAIAFERTLDGQVLDFGTTGRLRFSNLVMYDRPTESWWQQATGQAIAGRFAGRQLTLVPANMVAWADVQAAYSEARVLSRDTGHNRDYGRNPYVGYDDLNQRPFLYDGPLTPDELPSMARVLGVNLGGEAVAYPYPVLRELRVANDTVGGQAIVLLWTSGVASALDAGSVADGQDVGTMTAFSRVLDGRVLTFQWDGAQMVDDETGSVWNGMGHAVSGPLAGNQLQPVVGVNYFWFTWAAFRPNGRVYAPADPSAQAPAEEMEAQAPATYFLKPDGEIISPTYQFTNPPFSLSPPTCTNPPILL